MSVEKFDFTMMLQQGHEAAEQVIANKKEIRDVFAGLKASLTNYLGFPVELWESPEYEDEITNKNKLLNPLALRIKTGRTKVQLLHEETKIREELFLIKRSEDGYPISAILGKNDYMSTSQDEFYASISTIISSPQVNLQLRKFKMLVEEKINPK